MMKRVLLWLVSWIATSVQAAGFYELDYDWSKPSKQVVTATVGGSMGRFSPMLVVDTTGYYEGFVGYSIKLGPVSVTPYVGLEGLKGMQPRPRGMFVASTRLGAVNVLVLNEFGGVTGNFHKERLWMDAGPYSFGLVHHRFAGFGPRIDYRLSSGTAVYVQYLRKGSPSRLTVALVGTF